MTDQPSTSKTTTISRNEDIFSRLRDVPNEVFCSIISQMNLNQLVEIYDNPEFKETFIFCSKTQIVLKSSVPVTIPIEFFKNFTSLSKLYLINIQIKSLTDAKLLPGNEYKWLANSTFVSFQVPKMNNILTRFAILRELWMSLKEMLNMKDETIRTFGFEIMLDKPIIIPFLTMKIPSILMKIPSILMEIPSILFELYIGYGKYNIFIPERLYDSDYNADLNEFPLIFLLQSIFLESNNGFSNILYPPDFNAHDGTIQYIEEGEEKEEKEDIDQYYVVKNNVRDFIKNADLSNITIVDDFYDISTPFKKWWEKLSILQHGLMKVETFGLLIFRYLLSYNYNHTNWMDDKSIQTYLPELINSREWNNFITSKLIEKNAPEELESTYPAIFFYESIIKKDSRIATKFFYQSSATTDIYKNIIYQQLIDDTTVLAHGTK